jgi:hypothetical protein
MWSNSFKGIFTDPMGQESIIISTPRTKENASEIIEGSPLYHAMNKLISKFDELEKRVFGVLLLLCLMMHILVDQPLLWKLFHYHYDQNMFVLPLSLKVFNYSMRASLSVSRLTKLLVNSIHIYGSKSICYENIFRN